LGQLGAGCPLQLPKLQPCQRSWEDVGASATEWHGLARTVVSFTRRAGANSLLPCTTLKFGQIINYAVWLQTLSATGVPSS